MNFEDENMELFTLQEDVEIDGGGRFFNKKSSADKLQEKINLYNKNFDYLRDNIELYLEKIKEFNDLFPDGGETGEDLLIGQEGCLDSLFYLLGKIKRDVKAYQPAPLGRGLTRLTRSSSLKFEPYEILPFIGGNTFMIKLNIDTDIETEDREDIDLKFLQEAAQNSNLIITYALRDSINYGEYKDFNKTLEILISKILRRMLEDKGKPDLIDQQAAEAFTKFDKLKSMQDNIDSLEKEVEQKCNADGINFTRNKILKTMRYKLTLDKLIEFKTKQDKDILAEETQINRKLTGIKSDLDKLKSTNSPLKLSVLIEKRAKLNNQLDELNNKKAKLEVVFQQCKKHLIQIKNKTTERSKDLASIKFLKETYKATYMPKNYGFSLIDTIKELKIWESISKSIYSGTLFLRNPASTIGIYMYYWFNSDKKINTPKQGKDLLDLFSQNFKNSGRVKNSLEDDITLVKINIALLYDLSRQIVLNKLNLRESTKESGVFKKKSRLIDEFDEKQNLLNKFIKNFSDIEKRYNKLLNSKPGKDINSIIKKLNGLQGELEILNQDLDNDLKGDKLSKEPTDKLISKVKELQTIEIPRFIKELEEKYKPKSISGGTMCEDLKSECETIPGDKNCYRKLALKWHPDRNRGNEVAAGEKFKEVEKCKDYLVQDGDSPSDSALDQDPSDSASSQVPSDSALGQVPSDSGDLLALQQGGMLPNEYAMYNDTLVDNFDNNTLLQQWQFISFISKLSNIDNYRKILIDAINQLKKDIIPVFPSITLLQKELKNINPEFSLFEDRNIDIEAPDNILGCAKKLNGDIPFIVIPEDKLEDFKQGIKDHDNFIFYQNSFFEKPSSLVGEGEDDLSIKNFIKSDKLQSKALNILNLEKNYKVNKRINLELIPQTGIQNSKDFTEIFYLSSAISATRQLITIEGAAKNWLDGLLYSNSFIKLIFSPESDNWRSYKSYWSDVYNWWNNNLESSGYLLKYYHFNIFLGFLKRFYYCTNINELILFDNNDTFDLENNCITNKANITNKFPESEQLIGNFKDKLEQLAKEQNDFKSQNQDDKKIGGKIRGTVFEDSEIIENRLKMQNKPSSVINFVHELSTMTNQDISPKEEDELAKLYLIKSTGYRDMAKDMIIEDYQNNFTMFGDVGLTIDEGENFSGGAVEDEGFSKYNSLLDEIINLDSPVAWIFQMQYFNFNYNFLSSQKEGKVPVGTNLTLYCKNRGPNQLRDDLNIKSSENYISNANLGFNFILTAAILDTSNQEIYELYKQEVLKNEKYKQDDIKSAVDIILEDIKSFIFVDEFFKETVLVGQILYSTGILRYLGFFYKINKLLENEINFIDIITPIVNKQENNLDELKPKITIYISKIAPMFQKSADNFYKASNQKSVKDLIKELWNTKINDDTKLKSDIKLAVENFTTFVDEQNSESAMGSQAASVNAAELAEMIKDESKLATPDSKKSESITEGGGKTSNYSHSVVLNGDKLNKYFKNKTLKKQTVEKLGGRVIVRKTEKNHKN